MHTRNRHALTTYVRLIRLVFILFLTGALAAEQLPDRERGFKPEQAYQYNGFDTVSLFNGNLNLSLPLATYPVSADVSYSFALRYSGNVWDYAERCDDRGRCWENWSAQHDNAGVGWFLSFGELSKSRYPFNLDPNDGDWWVYSSPDGSTHQFYETLLEPVCDSAHHDNCDPVVPGIWYTRDNSYLRIRTLSESAVVVEFPDGGRHRFRRDDTPNENWALEYIYGVSSTLVDGIPTTNYVHFTYAPSIADPATITIDDSHGRTHTVTMIPDEDIVDKIELAAFQRPPEARSNAVATYDLIYNNAGDEPVNGPLTEVPDPYESSPRNPDVPPRKQKVRLLNRVDLPGGDIWRFTYHVPNVDYDPASMTLEQAILPTGGRIRWSYQPQKIGWERVSERPASGVKERCMRTDDAPCSKDDVTGNQLQYLDYELADNLTTVKTYVRSGNGWGLDSKVENHFNGDHFQYNWSPFYGLPFSTTITDGAGLHLSTVAYDCDPATGDCTVDRKTYVRYEHDQRSSRCVIRFQCERDLNRRLAAEKTVFVADGNRYSEATYDDYDGLGHYRVTYTASDFDGPRRIFRKETRYNDNLIDFGESAPWTGTSVGKYAVDADYDRQPGYTSPPWDTPWNLNTFTSSKTEELNLTTLPILPIADRSVHTEACFSPLDGFLYRKRIKSSRAGSRSGNDHLSVFTRDAATGSVAREELFGNDQELAVPAGALCTLQVPDHDEFSFTVEHTYDYGVLKTSKFAGASFLNVDNVIDPNTGLISASRDAAGQATTWLYDRARRLEKMTPPGGLAPTTYTFEHATTASPARVTVKSGSGSLESRNVFEFDPFGRVSIDKRLMADGTMSGRKTEYDSAGRRASVSEQATVPATGTFAPAYKTSYQDYDPQGRPGKIVTADGSTTTFAYQGDRVVTRTTKIAVEGHQDDVPVSVEEHRDFQGRLIRVVEDVGGPLEATTEYDYDVAGKLQNVRIVGSPQPPRTFRFDGRGLITEEVHPESGTTTFKYDARGNAIERTTPENTVTTRFDFAGRMLSVKEGEQTLKLFTYDRPNSSGDASRGKLDTATRFNYSPELGTVSVRERHVYGGPGGRVSKTETLVRYEAEAGQTEPREEFQFSSTLGYDSVGNLVSRSYPSCDSGSCESLDAPDRTVTSDYQHGFVTGVPGYTVSAANEQGQMETGITYHPNGAIATIKHRNASGGANPIYRQSVEHGMSRPAEITVTGFCDDLTIDTQPVSKTVTVGSPADLSIVAPSASTIVWYRVDGETITQVGTGSPLMATVTAATTFFARVGNGTCTLDSNRVVVGVGDCPTPGITAPATVVAGLTATASVPETVGVTYAWTIQNGTIVSGANTREIIFQPTGCSGNVTLSVTVGGSCTNSTAVTQTVAIVPPRAAVTGSATIDPSEETTIQAFLTGKGPWVVTWSDGVVQTLAVSQNVAARTVDPAVTTTYTVTALVDGAGCSGTSTGAAVIRVEEPPADCGTASFSPTPYPFFSTIMPLEATVLQSGIVLTGADAALTKRYHFRWYQDGDLAQSNEQVYPNVNTNDFQVRFTNQTIIRLDAWATCHDAAGVEKDKTPVISTTSIGVMWDHCPTLPVDVDPQNVVLPAGDTVDITAKVPPYPDYTLQWYAGESGNTRELLSGRTGPTLRVSEPGTYWARATTGCGTTGDSATVVVSSITGCSPVRIVTNPQGATIAANQQVPLSVSAAGSPVPTYFIWTTPDGNVPDSRAASINVRPIRTTDYAARVGNDCSMVSSEWARIHVTSCADMTIVTPPQDQSVAAGTPVSIDILATAQGGAQLYYQWYEGESGDTTKPIGGLFGQPGYDAAKHGPALDLGIPTSTKKYWVRLSFHDVNKCEVDSRTATVAVCSTPVITNPVNDRVSQFPGQDQTFSVGASGENLSYAWYEGADQNDESKLKSSTSAVRLYPNVTTDYYVKVTSDCATGQSDRSVKASFRISVCPDFRDDETPVAASTLVPSGGTTTLTVSVHRGDFMEWYKVVGTAAPVKFAEGAGLTSVTTPAITATTSFYATARSGSCTKTSNSVNVNTCSSPQIHWQHGPTQVAKATSFTMAVGLAQGETANFRWYRGTTSGDVANSTLVYSSSGTYNVSGITETTSYWVRALNESTGCYSDTPVRTVTVCVPTINAQPQPVMIASGASTTLSVGTDNLPGVTYQWYTGIRGDTSSPVSPNGQGASLTVSPSVTTSYWVRVMGCPSPLNPVAVDSDAATVTICKVPAITEDLTAKVLPRNYSLTLDVTATGDGLHYQWYEGAAGDTSKQVGTDSNAYTFTTTVSKRFWVKVTGTCGSAVNSAAPLVSVEPAIATHPAGGAITRGTTRTLTVAAAAGSTELRYEWYQRTATGITLLSGTTSSPSFTTPAIDADSTFFARVFSGLAKTDSNDAVLTLCAPSTFSINQPNDTAGSNVTLSIDSPAAGETYAWYRNNSGDTSSPAGTGASIVVAPNTTTYYWVRTTRATCTADSAPRAVTVCRPKITTQPASTTITNGGSTTLSVAATGTGTLYYQWYTGTPGGANSIINGATSATYPASPTSTTTYFARVTSSSTCSTRWTDSAMATVTVCNPPAITEDLTAKVVPRNYSLTLNVTATGDGLHYQWYEGAAGDTSKQVGTDSNAYTFTTSVSKRFWVKVTGSCGTAVNSAAPLISVEPQIATHPAGGAVTKGSTRTLTVAAAAGSTELRYEWYQRNANGTITLLSGATSSPSFATPAIDTASTFFARVFSGLAKTDSNDAVLTVCGPNTFTPTYTTQVSSSAVRLTIDAPAAGETYQWFRGNSGDTSNAIGTGSLIDVYPAETTNYWVRTTRATCTADSAERTIVVCRPKITADPASVRIPNGTSTRLTVAATGTGPLYYSWYIGTPGGGASLINGANLSYYDAAPSATTTYFARVTSSSTCATRWTDSAAATVTVCNGPAITDQDGAKVVPWNYNLTLQVIATGDDLHYQWYRGPVGTTTTPVGQDNYQYTFTTDTNTTYWVRITGSCGPAKDSAPMEINVYPRILTQPANTSICGLGSTANFSVSAYNAQSYQWYRQVTGQAAEMVGTNSPSLSIAVPNASTQFWVVVTAGLAKTNSNKVSATVNPVPTVNSFTYTAWNATQWKLTATVASADSGNVKYKFFEGQLGNTAKPLQDGTFNYTYVTPTATSRTFWVRVYYTTGVCYTDREVVIP